MRSSPDVRRVLLVDDVVPDAALGSGYPRQCETIEAIGALPRTSVSIYPTIDIIYPANEVGAVRPWTGTAPLAVVTGELDVHLGKELAAGRRYDVVVISRPHNYEFVIESVRKHLPAVPVVYDAEALFYRRMERQASLLGGDERDALVAEATKMRHLEEKIASDADELVFVSEEEAELLRPFAKGPVTVNTPLLRAMHWTPSGFSQRQGVAYVAGWASGPKSPNIDGMQWFAREVWPRVLARQPDARLSVTGARPPVEVCRFACESIRFVGRVDDLAKFYDSVRVVVVPNRFGAGVKNKTMEALQGGVPTVSTTVGAEGLPLDESEELSSMMLVSDDATESAEAIVELLGSEQRWNALRDALDRQRTRWAECPQPPAWPMIIERMAPLGGSQ